MIVLFLSFFMRKLTYFESKATILYLKLLLVTFYLTFSVSMIDPCNDEIIKQKSQRMDRINVTIADNKKLNNIFMLSHSCCAVPVSVLCKITIDNPIKNVQNERVDIEQKAGNENSSPATVQ